MERELERFKAQGILNDVRLTEGLILSLLGQIKTLERQRDDYQEENLKLREAMKIKEEAATHRIEAMKNTMNAEILEMKSEKILRETQFPTVGCVPGDFQNDPYVRPVQALDGRDEDIYSRITTAIAKVATDDVTSRGRSTGSVASLEERIEFELHDEPPRADSSAPQLPPRRRSISQSTVYRIASIRETPATNREEDPKSKDGVLLRFFKSFRRTKTS